MSSLPKIRFSDRTGWLMEPNALSLAIRRKRAAGESLIDLTESNPSRCRFDCLNDPAILEPFSDHANLRYEPDPHGLLEAREAVCRYYSAKGAAVSPDQVFLTAGTSECYSYLFRLLVNPGESIMVPRPSYPLFDYLCGLNDVQAIGYDLNYKTESWSFDGESARNAYTPAVKAIACVNPNNPTGNFVKIEDREIVCRPVAEKGAAIIADEVFLDFCFDDNIQPRTFAAEQEWLTFTLSGISKIAGLPQMKISWIVVSGPRTERERAIERLEVIADCYLSAAAPSQRALSRWLEWAPAIQRKIRERVSANLLYLSAKLKGGACRLLTCEGGWAAVVRLDRAVDEEELVLRFLEKGNVVAHPGFFYEFSNGSHWVVSLLPPLLDFKAGIERCLGLTPMR